MNTDWSILAEPFVWSGAITALITAVVCAYFGVYVILKRIVFVSVALAEVAGLGVACGMFFGVNHQLAAVSFTFLAAFLFWLYFSTGHALKESLVGYVYCVAAAAAIILLAMNPMARARGVDIVSGNFLYAQRPEIIVLALISAAVITIQLLFAKEFIAVSFDRDFARICGTNSRFWEFILYFSLGLTISASMRLSGLVYVFGSLLIPAWAGLLLGRGTIQIFLIAVCFAAFNTLLGFALALVWDTPPAPTMVVFYGISLLLLTSLKAGVIRLTRAGA